MIINILLILLVVYACFTPFLVIWGVKFGIKITKEPEKAAETPFFNIPEKKPEPKMSPEEKRRVQILENIEAYNGTAIGQKEIK